jgi:hypothetical protein
MVCSGPGVASSASTARAAEFAASIVALAIQNTDAPMPPLLMSSVLSIISSSVGTSGSTEPDGNGTSTSTMSAAQAASIAASAASTTALLSAGALVGALPGEAPVIITTPRITISAQLQEAAEIANVNYSIASSTTNIVLPATMISDSIINASQVPSIITTSLVQYKDNIYSFASNPSVSTSAPIVSFKLTAQGGADLVINNLSRPILIAIPLYLSSMPSGFAPGCRFWDEKVRFFYTVSINLVF